MEIYELRINKKDYVVVTSPRRKIDVFYLVPNYDEKKIEVYSERRGQLENVTESFALGQNFIFGSHDEGDINFRRLNHLDDERIFRQIENLSLV